MMLGDDRELNPMLDAVTCPRLPGFRRALRNSSGGTTVFLIVEDAGRQKCRFERRYAWTLASRLLAAHNARPIFLHRQVDRMETGLHNVGSKPIPSRGSARKIDEGMPLPLGANWYGPYEPRKCSSVTGLCAPSRSDPRPSR
jgi:hypothetical protein